MDENKAQALRDINYQIQPVCAFCVHGEFKPGSAWGDCSLHHYEHKKHDNPEGGRKLSIHIMGGCSSQRTSLVLAIGAVGHYREFLP